MKSYTYKYPKPSVTTDCIILKENKGIREILLIKRKNAPYQKTWALPGGFVEIDEDLQDGAKRELAEETGLTNIALTQFGTYGQPDRDPRGRTISVIYYGYFMGNSQTIQAGDDPADASWFDLDNLPELAFDHELIINDFKKRILQQS